MMTLLLIIIYISFISLGLPDSLLGARYYQYGENKNEQSFRAYWEKIKHTGGGSPI